MYFENLWHEQLKIIICASRSISCISQHWAYFQFHRYVRGYLSCVQFHKYVEGYQSFSAFGKHSLQEICAPSCKNSRVNVYRSHI